MNSKDNENIEIHHDFDPIDDATSLTTLDMTVDMIDRESTLTPSKDDENDELVPHTNYNQDKDALPTWGYTFISFFAVLGAYLANTTFIFGRSSTSIIGTQMVKERLISESNLGQIVAAGMVGNLVGALAFGPILDKIGIKIPTLVSILIDFVVMILIFWYNSFWFLVLFYFIYNLFAMAAHAARGKVAKEWVHPSQHGIALGFLATSSNSGRIFALIVFGSAFQLGMPWKYSTFIVAGLLVGVLVFYLSIFLLEFVYKVQSVTKTNPTPHELDDKGFKSAFTYFASSARFWLAISIAITSNCIMDSFAFLPLYMVVSQGVSVGWATIASSAFAAGATLSIFLVGLIEDKISKRSRLIMHTTMLIIGTMLCATFVLPIGGYWITTILLSLFGFCLAASSYLSYSSFLVKFGGPYVGTLYSVMETAGSGGKIFYDLGQGYLIEHYGFEIFWTITTGLCILNLIFVILFLYVLWKYE